MVMILKWILIVVIGLLALMNAALTASLIWHMYRYNVPGAWIGSEELTWQYWTAPATIVGLLVLLKTANPTERKACLAILVVVAVSFALFIFLHLTGRLEIK